MLSKLQDQLMTRETVALISQNRNRINCMNYLMANFERYQQLKNVNEVVLKEFDEQKFLKDNSESLDLMEPITIKEMMPNVARYYAKRVLNCTIIDDPCFSYAVPIEVVLQDNERSTCLGMFADFLNFPDLDDKFGYARKIRIRNPFFNGCTVGVLNNDDVEFICERNVKRCRICGITNDTCRPMCFRRCNLNYCSEKCFIFDFEHVEHRMICI